MIIRARNALNLGGHRVNLVQLFRQHTSRPSSRLVFSRTLSCASGLQTLQTQPIQLRDYQEECIQAVLGSLDNGHKRLGISLATGSGKTVIFTQLINRVKPRSEDATQTLIVAHRRELVEQAARHCSGAYPDKTIDIEMGKLSASGAADITVASLQSIVSGDRLLKYDPNRFKLVLVDEAHHIVSPGYMKILSHLGLDSKRPSSPHLVGVSATFSRFDGLKLGAAIDEIVYHKDYVDMIGDKWLSDVIFTTVQWAVDLSRVETAGKGNLGEFVSSALSKTVNTAEANDIAIRAWFAKATGRKSTLVFCVDLDHVAAMTQRFRHHGIDARFVTGDTPSRERAERLDAFKRGEFPVLVNCGVFTEGTDIPNIDCILLARPTKSRNLLVQMIGRGMRLHPGKENCHIIDMVSSLSIGVITTPTLLGLDPAMLLDNASADKMEELRDLKAAEESSVSKFVAAPEPTERSHKITLTDYESVFDLIADTSGEQHIRATSPLSWVQVGQDKYVLASPTKTFLRLEKVEDNDSDTPLWRGWEVRALPASAKAKFAAPRELLTATTFVDAVHGCDHYAKEAFPYTFISRRQRWREGPATEKQLKFLNQTRSGEDQLEAKRITRGQAADMITKLKHGARGRFSKLQADKKREIKLVLAADGVRAQKRRETVSVGPLLH
ncbi:P-loop containing nucleoside triphosphate hydrolase protein [Bombardia bombarda]|uniref:P-loop containing nucleoside triphosphate hydrolase protein n=1 Tax=Bombardia bombarda TaxID=252184 RepID=A0AA40C9Z3_9PEZI|nr:P-loop containing nucleoside triphosphate hydrolase protein [Bombardia bombarda]